jgi:hypothetical protein
VQNKLPNHRRLLLFFLFAFALRLAFVWIHERHVSQAVLNANAAYSYEQGWIARSLLLGKGFSSPKGGDTGPTAMYTPVYPWLLAGIFKIFGIFTRRSFLAALSLNCFWSALTVFPLLFVARRLRRDSEMIAAFLWAIYPSVIAVPDLNWTQALSGLLIAAVLWATLVIQDSEKKDWILYGLLWGIACLVNPAILASMPFVLLWHCWNHREQWAKYAQLSGLTILTFVAVCAPWTVRNFNIFQQLVPLRSSFGYELWLGNNARVPHVWMGASADLDPLYSPSQFHEFQQKGEVEYIKERKDEAVAFIRTHPKTELRFSFLRLANFWEGTWYMGVDQGWAAANARGRMILICDSLLPLLALPGIWIAWRERISAATPAFLFLIFFPLVYYVTHGHTGYRNPLDPILILFASLFVKRLIGSQRIPKVS